MHRSNTGESDRSVTRGSDFLQLDPADAPPGGLSDWLTERLRNAIADGRLPIGSRLPATRALAADLRVSRGVITEAYQRLIDDGHIAGRGRAGTIVVAAPLTPPPAPTPNPPPGAPFPTAPGTDAFDVLRAAPARIDLTPGVPDLSAFPRAAWQRAERTVLRDLPAAGLGYGDPRGTPALRTAVAAWLARTRGIRADPTQIVIVAGTAQALGLIARTLTHDGIDTVAVEDPGSLGVRQHLRHWGITTPPIPVDHGGVRVDRLRESGAPAVLLTPAHQFPTGVVLTGDRRRDLLRWAATGGLVIEDDYDAEHRYDRPPAPALRSMLPDRVFHAGSVSKLLAPALRTGWLVPPPRFLDAVIAEKRFADLGNAALPQLVLAELMTSGEMERILRLLRRRHRRRRDTMIAALAAHLPDTAVHGAAAGLHLTITFGENTGRHIDDAALAAAALHEGVKVHPLSWHAQRPTQPGLVLGYAAATTSDITDGIAALGRALKKHTPRHPAPHRSR
ncbi:MocR-like pyridoxine biosynthesis transcription factor PdxR [Actinomadura formosensis]|uniref:MocR-like pyridoxine biosynthesis transcription factor PdxR n=1 Tax=Actinomadura formosensis TaxID=60706 RepID=UPI00083698EA|nr:PLP-dependent aminotransferase family protein [Actinomadura formosensis]